MNRSGTRDFVRAGFELMKINCFRSGYLWQRKKKQAISWKWDGSHFTDGGRRALADSVDVLFPLAEEAQNGYPCLRGVRNALRRLDADFDILENRISPTNPRGKDAETAATIAAAAWKEALKQVLVLRKNCTAVSDPRLQALIDYLVPDVATADAAAGSPRSPTSFAPPLTDSSTGAASSGLPRNSSGKSLVPIKVILGQRAPGADTWHDPDGDVELCSEVCSCVFCAGPIDINDSDVDTRADEDREARKHEVPPDGEFATPKAARKNSPGGEFATPKAARKKPVPSRASDVPAGSQPAAPISNVQTGPKPADVKCKPVRRVTGKQKGSWRSPAKRRVLKALVSLPDDMVEIPSAVAGKLNNCGEDLEAEGDGGDENANGPEKEDEHSFGRQDQSAALPAGPFRVVMRSTPEVALVYGPQRKLIAALKKESFVTKGYWHDAAKKTVTALNAGEFSTYGDVHSSIGTYIVPDVE